MNYKETFKRVSAMSAVVFVAGLALWLASWAVLDKPPWGMFVTILALLTSITQAAFVIAILLRTASAKWGARLYRLTASAALAFMPFAVTMLIIVLLARSSIIPWSGEEEQHLWYNPIFFYLRNILYFGLFYGLTYRLLQTSQLKGTKGAEIGNHRLMVLGLATVVTFVYGATFFSWDLSMTLNHHYADTIFGAYYIMNAFFGGTALIILLLTFLKRVVGNDFFTPLHFRNLATLAMAMGIASVFGWWSQFFPIWYANLPEETNAIYLRIFSGWGPTYGIMMVMVSVIPLITLLFKRVRASATALSTVSVIILVGLWIQQYLSTAAPLINDGLAANLSVISLTNIALTAGILGGFSFVLLRILQRHPNMYLPEDAALAHSDTEADYLFSNPEGW